MPAKSVHAGTASCPGFSIVQQSATKYYLSNIMVDDTINVEQLTANMDELSFDPAMIFRKEKECCV
jgi:hypothetical protein